MVSDIADVVGVRELDVEGDSQVAFVVTLLVRVVITVAIIANVGTYSYPSWKKIIKSENF